LCGGEERGGRKWGEEEEEVMGVKGGGRLAREKEEKEEDDMNRELECGGKAGGGCSGEVSLWKEGEDNAPRRFKCIGPDHPAHGGVTLRTVQCRPAAACARKSPLRVHSKETRQDKTRTRQGGDRVDEVVHRLPRGGSKKRRILSATPAKKGPQRKQRRKHVIKAAQYAPWATRFLGNLTWTCEGVEGVGFSGLERRSQAARVLYLSICD
jgi:hypothetical protein